MQKRHQTTVDPTIGSTVCPQDSRPIAQRRRSARVFDDDLIRYSDQDLDQNCECDYQKCESLAPDCDPGLSRRLVAHGSNRPGSCCERFECQELELRCRHIKCLDPSETFDIYAGEDPSFCPNDSYRPVAYVPQGSCCPTIPQCRCRPEICAPAPKCARGEILAVARRGDGRPGRCCDRVACLALSATESYEDELEDGQEPRTEKGLKSGSNEGSNNEKNSKNSKHFVKNFNVEFENIGPKNSLNLPNNNQHSNGKPPRNSTVIIPNNSTVIEPVDHRVVKDLAKEKNETSNGLEKDPNKVIRLENNGEPNEDQPSANSKGFDKIDEISESLKDAELSDELRKIGSQNLGFKGLSKVKMREIFDSLKRVLNSEKSKNNGATISIKKDEDSAEQLHYYANPMEVCREHENASSRKRVVVHLEGERWQKSACESCACSGGVALCRHMQCPKVTPNCGWVGVPENECCPICLGCKDDEHKNRQVNESWQRDDCTSCVCGSDFRWHCQKFICKQECESPRKVDGQCCPQCDVPLIVAPPIVCASLELCQLRCIHGLIRNQWGCYECQCAESENQHYGSIVKKDSNYSIGSKSDSNRSDSIREHSLASSNLTNTETFPDIIDSAHNTVSNSMQLTVDGNRNADYLDYISSDPSSSNGLEPGSEELCEPLIPVNCSRTCAHGFAHDSRRGCALCRCAPCPHIEWCVKQCLYGFETNHVGCSLCKCRAHHKLDNSAQPTIAKPTKLKAAKQRASLAEDSGSSKSIALILDELRANSADGCFSASSAAHGATIARDNGEWWTDSHCRQCFCQLGTEYCSIISCPHRPDSCPSELWLRKTGECCPSCVIEDSTNSTAFNTTLQSDSDFSTSRTSPLSSAGSSGPLTTTSSPNLLHSHYRPVCYGPGNGRLFVDGETWHLSACISCTCRMGHVLCASRDCAPLTCLQSVRDPDNCCLRCLENEVKSQNKVNLTSSNSTGSEAIGTLELKETELHGYCIDDTGLTHTAGKSWKVDECTSCRCTPGGSRECFTQRCADSLKSTTNNGSIVPCERTLLIKGQCCPICSDALNANSASVTNNAIVVFCRHGADVYAAGETFLDGKCHRCICRTSGRVKCAPIAACDAPNSNLYPFGAGTPETVVFQFPPRRADSSHDISSNLSNVRDNAAPIGGTHALLIASALTFSVLLLIVVLVWFLTLRRSSKKKAKKQKALKLQQYRQIQQHRSPVLDPPLIQLKKITETEAERSLINPRHGLGSDESAEAKTLDKTVTTQLKPELLYNNYESINM